MDNETGNTNPPTSETADSLEGLDADALKERLVSEREEHKKLEDTNRHLFARAKTAEGFVEKDGEWIKKEAKEPKETKSKETPEKPDDKLLERLDKMALQVAGINEADEVELFNKWKEQTGREADDIVGNDIFKKEIEDIRTAKANQQATSDISGGQDKSGGAKDSPDYWIAKATKGSDGKLVFPEETPKELYSKILKKIAEKEPGSSENLKFYNE